MPVWLLMENVLSLIETVGNFSTMVQGGHLEEGKDKPGRYQTEPVDAAGRDVKVCRWLNKIDCVQVGCESKSDRDPPTELIKIRKICNDVSVPHMKLLKYEAGNPPVGGSNWRSR